MLYNAVFSLMQVLDVNIEVPESTLFIVSLFTLYEYVESYYE